METHLRANLYQHLGRSVVHNPLEPEPFDLVDLSRDVTNATRIYHLRTECVREALEGACLIMTDSQPLAGVVQRVLPRSPVAALPFGHFSPIGEKEPGFTVGLLNHSPEIEMNNLYALKLLKALRRKLLIYGEALAGLEAESCTDLTTFAARCDVLLLPSMPGVINSPTLPLALMKAGTAILAHNAPGYYELNAATGVQLLSRDPADWMRLLAVLESQPAKLRAMQERNRAYAQRQNRESYTRLAALVTQFTVPPPRTSPGCACAKRKQAGAPTPDLVQPNSEKEQ